MKLLELGLEEAPLPKLMKASDIPPDADAAFENLISSYSRLVGHSVPLNSKFDDGTFRYPRTKMYIDQYRRGKSKWMKFDSYLDVNNPDQDKLKLLSELFNRNRKNMVNNVVHRHDQNIRSVEDMIDSIVKNMPITRNEIVKLAGEELKFYINRRKMLSPNAMPKIMTFYARIIPALKKASSGDLRVEIPDIFD